MQITVDNVSMTYPTGKRALRDISIDMESPNLVGLVGPNGAGKSTLMKLLVAGLLPTGGEIRLDGAPLRTQEKALKAQLGYLPQTFGLYDELTVTQFLDYMAALKGIRNRRTAIDKAIEETHLQEKRKARIRTLSGGQRQRVGIAQALLGQPGFLIFDEPTVGLDPEERINFRNLFSRAAQDKIVLLSTHIIEDVQSICNRLIVIHHGQLLFDGAPETLIIAAQGHVGVFEEGISGKIPLWRDIYEFAPGEEAAGVRDANLSITSRINTAQGVLCRMVAQELPLYAQRVEPTLEDAYMFLLESSAAAAGAEVAAG